MTIIQIGVQAPPEHFEIRVDLYGAGEREAFIASGAGDFISSIPKVIQVPTADFCTYYLYYRLQPGSSTFSHEQISNHWVRALVELEERIVFGDRSVHIHPEVNLDVGTKERIGEAIGLSVINHLHGVHLADWTKIPHSTSQKILDYSRTMVASDGNRFVQVEAKGSTVETFGTTAIPNAIVQQKSKIKAKKAQASEEDRAGTIAYGTIGILSHDPDSTAKCLLVDPPAGIADDPFRFKVVSRLTFIANLVSVISPRSVFAAALRSRLLALAALDIVDQVNNIPLVNGSANVFPAQVYGPFTEHNPFFQSRSVVTDGPVGGQVSMIGNNRVFFIGMREELIGLAGQQSFEALTSYSFPSATLRKSVRCMVPSGRFAREFKQYIPKLIATESGGYVQFRLTGTLFYSASGLVFGVLAVPEVK